MHAHNSDMSSNTDPIQAHTPTPVRSGAQRLLALGLVLLILTVGVFLARFILFSKAKPERETPRKARTPVQVMEVHRQTVPIRLQALGTVVSSSTLEIKPSVSGTISAVNDALIPGGFFQKGALLVELDPRDYQLALEQSRNELERAAMDLRIEEGNQAVARREYDLIKKYSRDTADSVSQDLALRGPQLAQAKAAEAAAGSAYKLAQLNLERTRVTAPFNCVVLEKNVAVGAQVSTQTTLAALAATDRFWVRVSIPREDVARIALPGESEDEAQVLIANLHDTPEIPKWTGRILKLLRDVDPQGLMSRLLIEVPHPTRQDSGQSPLLLGSMVQVSIAGKSLANAFVLPRSALRNDDNVLVATPGRTLDIRPVQVLWQHSEEAYIGKGLKQGELVITSPVAAPVPGMPLRLNTEETTAETEQAPR